MSNAQMLTLSDSLIAGKIDKIPFVNGLHHYYFRQAA
jgi:hypothetical protein